MPQLPDIEGADRLKPLGYDPGRGTFILFDDLIEGREAIIPLDTLSLDDLKLLVIERKRCGPDFGIQPMTGARLSRDDLIREIRDSTPFGRMALKAEVSYLSHLLAQIQGALHPSGSTDPTGAAG